MQNSVVTPLKHLVELPTNCNSPVLIPVCAYRPAFADLIFPLDNLTLCIADISGECEDEILGDSLLNGDTCGWIAPASSQRWIDLQTGKAG